MAESGSDRLAKLEQQQKELAEKIRQEKARLRQEERERENRRKAILGDLVLRHYREDAQVRAWVEALLDRKLSSQAERIMFGLEPRANATDTAESTAGQEREEGKSSAGE